VGVFYPAENERLPTKLGWRVRNEVVGVKTILRIAGLIGEATSLLTVDETAGNGTAKKLRRGFHAGVRGEL
jgi:hypothetical protein